MLMWLLPSVCLLPSMPPCKVIRGLFGCKSSMDSLTVNALMLRNTGMRPHAITERQLMAKGVMHGTMTAVPTEKAAAMIAVHTGTMKITNS